VVRARAGAAFALLFCTALTFVIFAAACASNETPRFPHVVHLTQIECGAPGKPACMSCSTCHSPSEDGRVAKLPEQSLCASCHEENPARLARVLNARPERPYGEIAFDHEQHLSMEGIGGQCVTCHGGVLGHGASNLPEMAACFTCHEHQRQWEQASCTPCHQRADLETILPVTFLRHDASFLRQHGTFAMTEETMCMTCHTESSCQSCHDQTQMMGVEQRLPEKVETQQGHRGDFMVRHAIEATSQPASCMSCHEPASCDSCHVERGVSGNAVGALNPHPMGWVGDDVDSKDFHGRAARRDLLSCAGCHEAGPATNCIRCHKVGAYGGNPHPSGWRSDRSTDARMCSYCHEGGI
jgi:hypothetical protein